MNHKCKPGSPASILMRGCHSSGGKAMSRDMGGIISTPRRASPNLNQRFRNGGHAKREHHFWGALVGPLLGAIAPGLLGGISDLARDGINKIGRTIGLKEGGRARRRQHHGIGGDVLGALAHILPFKEGGSASDRENHAWGDQVGGILQSGINGYHGLMNHMTPEQKDQLKSMASGLAKNVYENLPNIASSLSKVHLKTGGRTRRQHHGMGGDVLGALAHLLPFKEGGSASDREHHGIGGTVLGALAHLLPFKEGGSASRRRKHHCMGGYNVDGSWNPNRIGYKGGSSMDPNSPFNQKKREQYVIKKAMGGAAKSRKDYPMT